MRKITWSPVVVGILLVACSGGDPAASVQIRDTPGGEEERVVINPDNFSLRYSFSCEPLNCVTECSIQEGDWFECESPLVLTQDSEELTLREGVLRLEVRALHNEDVSSPRRVDTLVLYEFNFDIEEVHGFDTSQGDYLFEDEYVSTCSRSDCELECHWSVGDCEAGSCPSQECSLTEPFELVLPEGESSANLVIRACAIDFGGLIDDEHCTDPRTFLVYQAPPGWESLSAGEQHTCAILEDQSLWCWGANNAGQLGINRTENSVDTATKVLVGSWQKVSAGQQHTCAIHTNGALYCWGERSNGRLGFTPVNHRQPEEVDAGPFVDVAAGGAHSCAIREGGELYCWGLNVSGQVGIGDTQSANTPRQVPYPDGVLEWIAVSAGTDHTCALGRRSNNTNGAYCWGSATNGRLGNNQTSGVFSSPQSVLGGLPESDSHTISAGDRHTCATATQNAQLRSFCWGEGGAGRLGTGSNVSIPTPDRVENGLNYQFIAAGEEHSCGLHNDGTAFCWGENIRNQLGTGGEETALPEEVQLPFGFSAKAIATGMVHSCAIAENDRIYCWGRPDTGRLGIRDRQGETLPMMITWPRGEHVP